MADAPRLALPPCVYIGEREIIRGNLSADMSFRLVVRGDFGPGEISSLITLLEAQRSVLAVAAQLEARAASEGAS